jgi:hypothetical protein
MINVLIDTCSWIDMLAADDKDNYISHIEFWSSNNYIKLFTHEIIIEEWNKHKVEQKDIFEKSINTLYKHAREVIKKERIPLPYNLEPNITSIEKKISTIDTLLQRAEILRTTHDIKAFCSDRTISPRKAPFHNKIDSTKDAYIIFSALKYFKQIKQEFIFISSNKTEFGAPDNLENEIHPELIENYKKVKIKYYAQIGVVINDFKDSMPASLIVSETSQSNYNIENNDVPISYEKTLLDQLFDYITIRYREINFIPIHILTRHYPFKKDPDFFPMYSIFSLTVDNQDLIELLSSFKIKENSEIEYINKTIFENTLDFDTKLKAILTKLTKNLILEIHDRNNNKRIQTRYLNYQYCECIKCNFERLNFVKAFNLINIKKDNTEELIKLAHIHYRIGNYVKSAKYFKKSLSAAIKSDQKTIAYIAQYNLSRLANFIRNNYWGEHSQEELFKELKQIDLTTSLTRFETNENKKLLEWIKSESFYSDTRDSIQRTVSQIIDHYNEHLHGGWSLNSEIWKLINEYAQIDAFLSENYIIYDKYTEFKELTNVFIEGLFASHGIDANHKSRLKSFDDWLLSKIIVYGSAESINKYYLRYKLKKIKYVQSSDPGDTFLELVHNFFNNNRLREVFEANCERGNRTFWDFYNTLFCNIITIVSICDLDDKVLREITQKLFDYLKSETFIFPYSLKYIRYYIYRIRDKIEPEILEKLFHLFIQTPKYHGEKFFETIADIIETKHLTFEISDSDFEAIKKIAFGECPNCKAKHEPSLIISIYQCIKNENIRLIISNLISDSIKERFDFHLFYLSTLFEIIEFDEWFFTTFIESAYNSKDAVTFRSAFAIKTDRRFDKVNDLINLCYKFNIDLSEERFIKFKILDEYYSWLIDMENFDYDSFRPDWINEYPTKFYFKKISQSTKTKKFLEDYLRKNINEEIQNVYFTIYLRETW